MRRIYFITALFLLSILCLHGQEAEATAGQGSTVRLKAIDPYNYVAVEMKGSYDLHEQAFGTLYEQGGVQGIALTDYPMGIYYNSPEETPVDSLTWEIGMRVAGVENVKTPLTLKTFAFETLASMIFEGSFGDEMQMAYGQVYQWIAQNGYQAAGPLVEIFMTMPTENEQGEYIGQVEIQVPVRKAE